MRRRTILTGIGLLVVVSALGAYFFPQPKPVPLAMLEPAQGRLLVMAPHSDDETLATGGIIQQAEARGGRPQVVLVTGSDAFKAAAEAHYRRIELSGQDMINFGRFRLQESRAALSTLGLAADRLTFLGYADQSLNRLWTTCWNEAAPCQSKHTGTQQVPYAEARTPGAPYAGRALLRDLEAVLRAARPDVVAYPHPNEAHVDHWGLSNFMTAALEELRRTDPAWRAPGEWLYLVHRGDWPAPKGYLPKAPLLPPAKLTDGMTTWRTEPLTPAQVQVKSRAVAQYASQVAILRRFMHSFIRTNELFGSLGRVVLPAPGAPYPPGGPLWGGPGWVRTTTDPTGDTAAREIERSADLRAIWAASDGVSLFVTAELARPLAAPAELHLFVRGFRPGPGWGDLARVTLLPTGDRVGTSFNLGALGNPVSVMIGAETRLDGTLIDRAAWRLISLDGK